MDSNLYICYLEFPFYSSHIKRMWPNKDDNGIFLS